MAKIILISGHAQNGKDTTAVYMQEYLKSEGYRVQIMHYADELKFICERYFGWDGVKDDYGRYILQHVGTDVVRRKAPGFWVKRLMDIVKVFWKEWDYIIIPDARFPDEVLTPKAITNDCWHVRVERRNFKSPLTTEQQNHPSETALDCPGDHGPDFWIDNAGTLDDLRTSAIEVLRRITKE